MDFISRHKGKLIALGTVTVVGIGAYYYAKRMLSEGLNQLQDQMEEMQRKMVDRQLKETEIQRLKNECSVAILSFIRPLHKQLSNLTDPREITEKLKEIRQSREKGKLDPEKEKEMDQLWEDLKVISISRLLSAVYALALMDAMLRVQQHVIARYAFEEAKEIASKRAPEDKSPIVPIKITQPMRERYMIRSTEFFISTSLPKLIARVTSCVQKSTEPWKIGANVTRDDIAKIIQTIRLEVEGDKDGAEQTAISSSSSSFSEDAAAKKMNEIPLNSKSHKMFLEFLIQPDDIVNNSQEDEVSSLSSEQVLLLKSMLDESMDIMESPHFALCFEEALSRIFSSIMDDLKVRKFESRAEGESTSTSTAVTTANPASTPANEEFVLAKVLVGMKSLVKEILSNNNDTVVGGNTFVRDMEVSPSSDLLARLIFGLDPAGMEDKFGLGELGLGEEDMKLFSSLIANGATAPPSNKN